MDINDKNLSDGVSGVERKVLAVLQEGFPKSETPYKDMADRIGIETEQLLEILRDWKSQGKVRRIGAIVNHFKVGLGGGAMVVWQIEPKEIEKVGQILADFKEVSHAYERTVSEDWPYSFYSMVHAAGPDQVAEVVGRMSRASGITDYRVLATEKELKKVPPTYIIEPD